ncbi:MAG: hypothetical protein WC061_04015 [Melioribacteraceae bacterium]
MKRAYPILASLFLLIALAVISSGCKDNNGIVDPYSSDDSVLRALRKITENSPSVNSFTPNYAEDEAAVSEGALYKNFYPVKVRQRLNPVSRDLTLVKDSTTASGTLVQKFDGELIITGSFQTPTIGINSRVDTVIRKPFSTTITRFIKYRKIADTGNDTTDWKITSISLPAGGTESDSLQITKLTLTAGNGNSIVVDDPGTYFFNVGKDKQKVDDNDEEDDDKKGHEALESGFEWSGWKKLLTWFKKNDDVKLRVEILSKSSDPDLMTITYGAMMNGGQKNKYNFTLVSTVQEGDSYRRTYERNWGVPPFGGRMHAVINALTRASAYDADAPVVEKTWGIPYKVN